MNQIGSVLNGCYQIVNAVRPFQSDVEAALQQPTHRARTAVANSDKSRAFKFRMGTDTAADFAGRFGIFARVKDDHVRAESFRLNSGREVIRRRSQFVRAMPGDCIQDVLRCVVIHHEDAAETLVQSVQGHIVGSHEGDKLVKGYAAIAAARDAIPAQFARIKPLADRARCDVADACDFAGGQYAFSCERCHFSIGGDGGVCPRDSSPDRGKVFSYPCKLHPSRLPRSFGAVGVKAL